MKLGLAKVCSGLFWISHITNKEQHAIPPLMVLGPFLAHALCFNFKLWQNEQSTAAALKDFTI